MTEDFETRIARLDLSLFAAIDSQSDDGDRRSWLALQRWVRGRRGSYVYLEIGSYLGGSLQPHLLDPRCRRIYSIDNRPLAPPDDRGPDCRFSYAGNSTERMLANLRALDPHQAAKIVCFESDARDVDPGRLPDRVDLCFIDGEHTESAVLRDFDFCARACASEAIVVLHDDWLIYPALARILRRLGKEKIRCTAFKLGGSTFAIALGASSVPEDAYLCTAAIAGRRFIRSMRARRFFKRIVPPSLWPAARRLRRLLDGGCP
jgi:hypothetical protein